MTFVPLPVSKLSTKRSILDISPEQQEVNGRGISTNRNARLEAMELIFSSTSNAPKTKYERNGRIISGEKLKSNSQA